MRLSIKDTHFKGISRKTNPAEEIIEQIQSEPKKKEITKPVISEEEPHLQFRSPRAKRKSILCLETIVQKA